MRTTHSTFGSFLKFAIAGESHAPSVRFSLANFPRDFQIDGVALREHMLRRAPGRDELSTARREADEVHFISGVSPDAKTTGESIVGEIANTDTRPHDYGAERTIPRPGHADWGQWVALGEIPTGGGANSGRLTAAMCAAGGICAQFLATRGIEIFAKIESVHGQTENIEDEILRAKKAGDSVGGIITCEIRGVRAGLGGALFDGLESSLSSAIFAIPGVKAIEFGNGFDSANLLGSENNDAFCVVEGGRVATTTNRHGGLLGGRTSGMPITFRLAMKPTPTIFNPQESVDLATKRAATCAMKGRHDPCIVRRAVPVVESMAAFVLADVILADESRRARTCLTLTEDTLEKNRENYFRESEFVDLVELRVDLLRKEERVHAAEFPARVDVPVILTIRREKDGGAFAEDEESRKKLFREIFARAPLGRPFAFVDFEEDFRDEELARLAKNSCTRIIRSCHEFANPIKNFAKKIRDLKGATDEIPKLAFLPQSREEVERLFAETKDLSDFPHIVCAMGPLGLPTRVSAHRTHSFLTFASSGAHALHSLGHISPRDVRRAKKFAVIGHPIAHSLSPVFHAANFAACDLVATYEKFDVAPDALAEKLAWFRDEGFTGINVTIPHKIAILPFLDRVDASVAKFGACNTIRFERDGTLSGFNTDVLAFVELLAKVGFSLREKNVCIMGRGGAGSALAACAREEGARRVDMFGRDNRENARACAREADLIVNATPVGLHAGDESILPREVFRAGQIVLDLIPSRKLPPMADCARAAGATVLDGLDFLVAQGAASFEIWTGRPANRDAMKAALRSEA